jgi:hypothetical protein
MDEFSERILVALVEGYNARAGLKDRNRALTEYEIARRAGYTGFSYVEFSMATEREQVRAVLEELIRGGMIREWQRAGRYESYIPTELGLRRVSTFEVVREGAEREPSPDLLGDDGALPGDGLFALDQREAPPADDWAGAATLSPADSATGGPSPTAAPASQPGRRSSLLRRPALGRSEMALPPEAALNRLVEQLDEALLLLRAIDAKLGRDR